APVAAAGVEQGLVDRGETAAPDRQQRGEGVTFGEGGRHHAWAPAAQAVPLQLNWKVPIVIFCPVVHAVCGLATNPWAARLAALVESWAVMSVSAGNESPGLASERATACSEPAPVTIVELPATPNSTSGLVVR